MRAGGQRFAGLVLSVICFGLLGFDSAAAAEDPDRYALQSVSMSLSNELAGAHADLTTSFSLAEEGNKPFALTRDVLVSLPPGMIGNPQRFPRCSFGEFGERPEENECPQDAQVGVSELTLGGETSGTLIEPVYNMYSPGGDIVARFGLFAGPFPTVINVRVNPVDYSLVATVEGAPAAAALVSASTTLWGVPASSLHDEFRLTPQEALDHKLPPGGRASQQPEVPFLSNPTDCSSDREVTVTVRSYPSPERPSTMSAPFPQLSGCENLSFTPAFTAAPTNPEASAPTGLHAVLEIPQNEQPKGRATSTLKKAVVTLPPGLTLNPSAGDGLEACGPEEVGFGTTQPANCPDAAKIGSVEIV